MLPSSQDRYAFPRGAWEREIITDAFHQDRWDYVYTLREGDNDYIEKRRLTLLFKGNTLKKIDNRGYPNPKPKPKE